MLRIFKPERFSASSFFSFFSARGSLFRRFLRCASTWIVERKRQKTKKSKFVFIELGSANRSVFMVTACGIGCRIYAIEFALLMFAIPKTSRTFASICAAFRPAESYMASGLA